MRSPYLQIQCSPVELDSDVREHRTLQKREGVGEGGREGGRKKGREEEREEEDREGGGTPIP